MEKVLEQLKNEMERMDVSTIPMFWPTCGIAGKCAREDLCGFCDQSPMYDTIVEKSKEIIDICAVRYPAIAICFEYDDMLEIATEVANYAKDEGLIVIAYTVVPRYIRELRKLFKKESPFDIIQCYLMYESSSVVKKYLDYVRKNNKAIIFSEYFTKIEDYEADFIKHNLSDTDTVAVAIKSIEQLDVFPDHLILFDDEKYNKNMIRRLRKDAIALHELFPE